MEVKSLTQAKDKNFNFKPHKIEGKPTDLLKISLLSDCMVQHCSGSRTRAVNKASLWNIHSSRQRQLHKCAGKISSLEGWHVGTPGKWLTLHWGPGKTPRWGNALKDEKQLAVRRHRKHEGQGWNSSPARTNSACSRNGRVARWRRAPVLGKERQAGGDGERFYGQRKEAGSYSQCKRGGQWRVSRNMIRVYLLKSYIEMLGTISH